jgi:hypothetical protein
VPNKKENLENPHEKLGKALGSELAAQQAIREFIEMNLSESDSKKRYIDIREEAVFYEDKIEDVPNIFSKDKDESLYVAKAEETAKVIEGKAAEIKKTLLGKKPVKSEPLEFLGLAEGGEAAHYEKLQVICSSIDNK